MIAYEELCEALAQWRSRNGLANGPSAKAPQGPVIAPTPHAGAEVLPAATDEIVLGQETTVGPNPLGASPDDAPTGLHQAAPDRVVSEHTNEIELEGMLVRDEDV